MRQGARSLHYLGFKSTYDGCWGAKAPIIAIPFHLKSTFDSPECTYHDAMSCSTWVELPGIGAHNSHPSWWPWHSCCLVIFLRCFSGDDQSPLCTLGWRKYSAPPFFFCCHTCSPAFLVGYRDRAANNWTWRRFNDNDDNAPLAMT